MVRHASSGFRVCEARDEEIDLVVTTEER